MATLGLAYLVVISPAVMLAVCVWMYLQRKLSGFHRAALVAGLGYIIMVVLLGAGTLAYQLLRAEQSGRSKSLGGIGFHDRRAAVRDTSNYRLNPTAGQQGCCLRSSHAAG